LRKTHLLAWLIPPAVLVLVAAHLAAAKYPTGADSLVHTPTAAALYYVLRWLPADAPLFLRTLPFDRPPATYLLTAGLLAVGRSVWSYHGTILLLAAAFSVCYVFAARRLTRRADLAALGLLAVFANPEWVVAALSYNLDMSATAAAGGLAWIFLASGESSRTVPSIFLGLLAGALCLTRPTVAALLAPAAFGAIVLRVVQLDWRGAARALVFLAVAAAVAVWWNRPGIAAVDNWRTVLARAEFPPAAWHYPFRLVALHYAALPLLLALLAAIPFAEWKKAPPRIWLLPPAALGALGAFAATGANGPGVALGAYALLTLFALAALDAWPGKARDRLVYGLLGLYAFLALGVWIPALRAPVRLASLGSSAPPAILVAKPYFWDEKVAETINAAIDGRENCPALVVDDESQIDYGNVEARLVLEKPYLALMFPLRQPALLTRRFINESCFVLSMQKRASVSLAAPEPNLEPNAQTVEASVGNVMNLVENSPKWLEVASVPVQDKTLVVYKNNERTAKTIGRGTPDGFLDYYLLNYADDQRAFLRHAQRLLRAGRFGDAFDHFRAANEKRRSNAAYEGLLAAAPHFMAPAKEAAFLSGVALDRPPPEIMLRVARRLYELEANKSVNGQFERWATWLLDALESQARGRAEVVEELFKFYLNGGDPERARALLDRELPRLADAEMTGALWLLAEAAYFKKQDALAKKLYENLAARPDLPVRRQALVAVRLAWLRGESAAPSFALDKIASPEQAREAAKYLVNQSYRLRLAGKPDQALLLLFDSERWLQGCAVCLDEIALEKARDCLAAGDLAEAQRQLALVGEDSELIEIANELEKAIKKRTK